MAKEFDPNAAALEEGGIFGLPYEEQESRLVFLPVPWDATTSYRAGTHNGPQAILAASSQIDLYHPEVDKPYEAGLYLLPESEQVRNWNREARTAAEPIIAAGGRIEGDSLLEQKLARVNQLSTQLNEWVYSQTRKILQSGKIPAAIGGDHAVPFGAIQAIAQAYPGMGVLHFDAHSDTRKAYEGFEWSHASIMYNVMEKIAGVRKLVQVGIRDYCQEEAEYIQSLGSRAQMFSDRDLAQLKFQGKNWHDIAQSIVSALPQTVYISFDIDGLDPRFCPHTGTPVPGGLDFNEALYVIAAVAKSGRKIVGFDLNEVAPDPASFGSECPDEWDANVGMRLLYQMTAYCLVSQEVRSWL